MLVVAAMTAGAAAGLTLAHRRLRLPGESPVLWRLGYGGLASLFAVLPGLLLAAAFDRGPVERDLGTWGAVCIVLFVLDWRRLADPRRRQRVSFSLALIGALLGALAAAMLGGVSTMAAGVLVGVAMSVQVLCPQLRRARAGEAGAEGEPSAPAPVPRLSGRTRPVSVSPRKRLWAILLCLGWFVGLGGLHRFYVGKVGTGLLWLLTGGLVGIGQLVDAILILTGGFRDHADRPLIVWESYGELRFTGRTAAVNGTNGGPPQPLVELDPAVSRSPVATVLSGLGGVLMFLAVLIGLALAVNLPAMIAADVFEVGLAGDLEREFGYAGWPALMDQIGKVAMGVVMVAAVGTLMVARRQKGFGPMFRAALGALGLVVTVALLRTSMGGVSWPNVARQIHGNRPGPAMEMFFQQADGSAAVMAAVFLLASVVVFCWPGKQKPMIAPPGGAGGAR
jgi:hypothetical protein